MTRALWALLLLALAGAIGWSLLRPATPPGETIAPVAPPVTADETAPPPAAEEQARAAARPPMTRESRLPSGQTVRITRRPRIDLSAGPLGPHYMQLLAAAESGAPDAQYRLGLALYRCRDAAADEAALARQVDQLYQTRRFEGWEVDNPATEERVLRQAYADCVGVPPSARREYRDWMQRAADNGLVEAQLNLMFHLPKARYCQFIEECSPEQARQMAQLREQARVQVQRALDNGAVEALRTVGGWHLNDEMGAPDPVEAYAHFAAYDQVMQAAGRERELVGMIESLRRRLRPVDLARAETRARELLANPRCCLLTR